MKLESSDLPLFARALSLLIQEDSRQIISNNRQDLVAERERARELLRAAMAEQAGKAER